MKSLIELLSEEAKKAFDKAGYEGQDIRVNISARPDLCEYQCNAAMPLAGKYKKAPLVIAEEVAGILSESPAFSRVEAVKPGFINLDASGRWICDHINEMAGDDSFGVDKQSDSTVIVDYGGPNVAKPLHVGHLRSAVIGESVKRICRFMGCNTIGDIHMGDWGLQMGLIIHEVSLRKPELPYFDESFKGEYPKEAPFTIGELEEIYPSASKKSKEDEAYREEAMKATLELQEGRRGYRALWDHIMNVSVTDMKKIYDALDVHFELWNGESTVQDRIPGMVQYLKDGGWAYMSEGALVVDVARESDKKKLPPCMILKSDGASLYNTTDLATLMDREENYKPDRIIYLTDKRQNMYFEQIFRCAVKTGITPDTTELVHIGFGTVNGKDGGPYKTREGGVPRLESLIKEIDDEMLRKISESNREKGRDISPEEERETSKTVALAAIKYGDLSNQASKDYIFDTDKFTSFEGDTGPYILYTAVRIRSIMRKYEEETGDKCPCIFKGEPTPAEKSLMKEIAGFHEAVRSAFNECAPHRICGYAHDLSDAMNSFYHGNRILGIDDKDHQKDMIALIGLTGRLLETCAELLGFSIPERM
ncbi:MAG: arginine--tRNA ligase [Lachnospiraceae bacterium]|nr:arginine--tRNA ligase [Lachnospiraceae bacterium]